MNKLVERILQNPWLSLGVILTLQSVVLGAISGNFRVFYVLTSSWGLGAMLTDVWFILLKGEPGD